MGRRYSLQQLVLHQGAPLGPETARELLGCVVHRLTVQTEAVSGLLKRNSAVGMISDMSLSPSSADHEVPVTAFRQESSQAAAAFGHLRHLERVHRDTLRLCQHVFHHPSVWSRWSKADAHLIRTTAEEVRSRHAPGLERWADVARIQREYLRHSGGAREESSGVDPDDSIRRLLQRRCGIQLLCDHLVKLSLNQANIIVKRPLGELLHEAGTEASAVCDAHWQVAPELVWEGDLHALVTAVRPWLYHALVEVLKNALSASVQVVAANHQLRSSIKSITLASPPPVTVRVETREADNCIAICIEDRGIGLPADLSAGNLERLMFGIGTTSASKRWDRLQEQQSYAAVRSPLSSLGVGLPVARMMMRHFGGDVRVAPRTHEEQRDRGCLARIELSLDCTILEPVVTVE